MSINAEKQNNSNKTNLEEVPNQQIGSQIETQNTSKLD